MRILIAEDERVSARRLEVVLTQCGYEVLIARDGLAAWEILRSPDAPNLAILDWMMPGMNGLDLCREVRRLRLEPYTFIILLTERNRREDVIEGLNAGADDYLTKPCDASELEVRLRGGRRVLTLMDEVIATREALRRQATHDSLTGLLNRMAVRDALVRDIARATREGTSLGLVMVDLDHFKHVNDTHGHMAGDAVLSTVGELMRSQMRPYDSLGRYGGEEFLIVLPGCGPDDVLEKADSLRRSIGQTEIEVVPGSRLQVTASMGAIAIDGSTAVDMDELIRAADAALYRAKHRGRNRVDLAAGLPSTRLATC